jgi:hypothetical protein
MKTLITFLLAFEIAFGASAPSFAQQAPAPANATLFADIASAQNRAYYPDVERNGPGHVSPNELQTLEDRWFAAKAQFTEEMNQHSLSNPRKTKTVDGKQVFYTDESLWATQLQNLLQMAERLVSIRAYTGASVDPSLVRRYEIRLSLKNFSLIEFLHQYSTQLEKIQSSNPYGLVTVRTDGATDDLVLSVNPERVVVFQTQKLASVSSNEMAKQYFEWLTFQGLYQDLAKILELQSKSVSELPDPAATIQAKFPAASYLKQFAEREEDILVWRSQSDTLENVTTNALPKLNEAGLAFINADILKAVMKDADLLDEKALGDRSAAIQKAQMSQISQVTTDLLYFSSTPTALTAADWENKVVKAIADASTILTRYSAVAINTSLDQAAQAKLLQMFEARREELTANANVHSIVREALQPFLAKLDRRQVLANQRAELNRTLIGKATGTMENTQDISMPALIISKTNATSALQLSPLAEAVLQALRNESSFKSAQNQYSTTLLALIKTFKTGDIKALIEKSPLPLTDLQTALKDAKFNTEAAAKVVGDSKDRLNAIAESRKKDLDDWLKVGLILRFDLPDSAKLKDLGLKTQDLTYYKQASASEDLIKYPILTSRLDGKNSIDDNLINRLKKGGDQSAIIGDHLAVLEQNIRKGMDSVEASMLPPSSMNQTLMKFARWTGMSTAPETTDDLSPELMLLFRTGTLLAANIKANPAIAANYTSMQSEFDATTDFRSSMTFLNEAGNVLMIEVLVATIVTALSGRFAFLRPLSKGFREVFDPVFGYAQKWLNMGTLAFVGGDLANRGYQWYDASENLKITNQFYQIMTERPHLEGSTDDEACAILGTCFFSPAQLRIAESDVTEKKGKFVGGIIALALIYTVILGGSKAYAPIERFFHKRALSRLRFDFQTMGLDESQITFNPEILASRQQQIMELVRSNSQLEPIDREIIRRVIEQSRIRMETEVQKQLVDWEKLYRRNEEAILELGLNRTNWASTSRLDDLMLEIDNADLPPRYRLHLLQQAKNLRKMLVPLGKRYASEPEYEKLTNEVFRRISGSRVNTDFMFLKHDNMRIRNFINPKQVETIESSLPAPIETLIARMRAEGVIDDSVENALFPRSKIYREYVQALWAEQP